MLFKEQANISKEQKENLQSLINNEDIETLTKTWGGLVKSLENKNVISEFLEEHREKVQNTIDTRTKNPIEDLLSNFAEEKKRENSSAYKDEVQKQKELEDNDLSGQQNGYSEKLRGGDSNNEYQYQNHDISYIQKFCLKVQKRIVCLLNQ